MDLAQGPTCATSGILCNYNQGPTASTFGNSGVTNKFSSGNTQITNAAAVAGICATVLARDAEWQPLRPTDAPWLGEQGRAAS